ncbi:hypothetical protein [Marinobacter sp. DS40M6]|uniref:hypothetical protein n=1 Tax=Marinobacter sp. DS40M6 TaxID=1597776 RepID=UPI00235882CB|nr:hypothetical protein [Marinobacter sp. DS40M6]MDC8454684.1 hypothetical protein [Marinobacter sp. DS40M6]
MVNPYNEIADQIDQKTIGNDKSATPERRRPLAPPNPYEASIKKVEQQRNVLLNRALKRAMSSPPDEIAEVIGLSRATGLNPEIVKGHKQEVEFRARQRETGAQVAALSHPGQEWLTEKYNLDLSRDDLANIKALDDAIQNRDYYEQTALERNLVTPVRDALLSIRSAFTSQKAAANAPVIPVLEQAEEILQTQGREKAREWAQRDERVRELGIHSNVDYFLRQSEDKRQELLGYREQSATEAAQATVETETERQGLPRNPRLTEAEGFTGVTSAIFNNPEIILQEATRATALSLPMLAMGAATGGVGAAAIGFETERSLEILSRLQKAGVDVTDTDVLLAAFADSDLMEEIGGEAVLKAGGVAAMDLLSFGVAGKLLAPAAIGSRALTGPQRELLNVMAQVPVQSAFEGGGEALGQLLADGEVDGAEVAIEMIAGAATSTPEVAVFGGRRIVESFTRKALDYRTAKRDRAYLTEVKDAVNQTKLQKRDTQALKELIAKLNEQAPAKEVFIGAEDFRELFQSRDMDPDEYAGRMDSVGNQYAEGLATGSDIAVSMEDFASIIAPLELAEDFIELARTQPLGMSPAEAEAWMSEEARPALDDVLSAQKDELLASGDRVFQEVTQALTATGMERRTAERNATLYRAFFETQAESESLDPYELFRSYNLDITRELPETLKADNLDALNPLLDALREELQSATTESSHADEQTGTTTPGTERATDLKKLEIELERLGLSVTEMDNDSIKAALRSLDSQASTDTDTVLSQDSEGDETSGKNRGRIRINRNDKRFQIELLENANLSTFLHESGHFFLEVLGDLSSRENASDRVKAQYESLLDWLKVSDRDAIATDQHEQFARGFEAYLMEGKAPTPELQSIFSRFRAWLLSIYRRISRLNVQLSGEVRQVMDRMLATDEAIAQAREGAAYSASLSDIEALNWTEQERARYQDLVTRARNDAEETLTRQQMADLDKVNQRWWKQETKREREKALKAMNEEMPYIARAILQKGVLPDGSALPEPLRAMKLSRQALSEIYPADSDVWKQLKAMKGTYIYTRKETGVHPDILAEVLGFGSGDELVRAVIQTQPIADEAQARADAAMKAAYPDLSLSGEASQETVEAIHNEKQAELLLTELKKLHSLGNRTGRPLTPARMLKETAGSVIAGTRAKDIRPDLYRRAEAKAGREAFEAAVRQDFESSYRAKQRQLLNHYLYREARQAQEASEKVYQYAKGFNRKSTRERIAKAGGGYLEQIDAIIDQHEFRRVSVRQLDRRQSLRAWADEQQANDLPLDIPEEVLERSQRVNYRELTMEELQGVYDSIRNIAHVANLKGRLLKDRQKRELEEARRQAVEGINQNANRKAKAEVETRLPFQEAGYMVGNYLASHRRLSSLIREMDGGKDGGTLWQLVMRPLNEAGDLETERTRIFNEALAKQFKKYNPGELSRFYRKEYIPELDYSLSKQGLLMMALNAGTADNWQKLVAGYQQRKGWTEEQMRAAINRLEKRDWEFVQGVLDLVNSLWPDIEAKEKRVKGIAPEKVPAQPIQTPYGTYAGGYFPLTYDERQSEKAYSDRVKEMAEKTMQGAFTAATTKRGFTKSRVEGVVLPVRLDFGVIFEHFNEVIHDLTHHEALLDVNRLLQSKSVQESIYNSYGNNVYRTMKAAVDDIAAGDVPAIHAHEKALKHLRNGVTIASMGWNIGTAAMQPLGITNSIVRIGPKWVGRGLKRWLGDAAKMENTANWIFQVSPYMKDRVFTQSREINDIRNQMRGRGKLSWIEDSYFWFITRMQMAVDIPTWLGAYEKAQSEGANEADAISMADQSVIDAQGGGQIKDLAQIQRGHPALKLFTNFISYFVTTWNLMAERYRLNKFENLSDAGRFATDFLLLYTVPAILGYYVSGAIRGFGGDDLEDPEEMANVLAREQLSYMLGGFIGIRELTSGIQGFYGYSGPAGTRFFSEAVGTMNQVSQGEADAAFAKSMNDMAGILFHYPSGQVERSVEGAGLILNGETMNPYVLLTGEKRE